MHRSRNKEEEEPSASKAPMRLREVRIRLFLFDFYCEIFKNMCQTDEEFLERCKYTPIRLTPDERQMLAVLQNSLNVSEYTDEVDCFSRHSKVFSGFLVS